MEGFVEKSIEPAFPQTGNTLHDKQGLLVRDYFAGQALQGFMAYHKTLSREDTGDKSVFQVVAETVYKYADALCNQRCKGIIMEEQARKAELESAKEVWVERIARLGGILDTINEGLGEWQGVAEAHCPEHLLMFKKAQTEIEEYIHDEEKF